MSANPRKFSGRFILGWALDSYELIVDILRRSRSFDFNNYVSQYKRDVYDRNIAGIINECGVKINLGGQTDKQRIITSDKPNGVFDFSLASQGLYRPQEYYSQRIADEYPDKFKDFEVPIGVVPADLVKERVINDIAEFYYEDDDGVFPCIKQQRGSAAIQEGIVGAKLDFATKTKKVYLTFKRNRGKVKYVEIYSLFYYTSLNGNTQYAIRHLPAMMVANYFEKLGIKVRFYMVRFVNLDRFDIKTTFDGMPLPMAEIAQRNNEMRNRALFVQPIIVKDFAEEFDNAFAFTVSSLNYSDIYEKLSRWAQLNEVTSTELYGQPDWEKTDYWVGFDRYRNKYQEYIKLGLLKSKEVLPEAMVFFHDYQMKQRLGGFVNNVTNKVNSQTGFQNADTDNCLALQHPEVNPFFSWWMRLSASNLKDKINLINSNELAKDIEDIRRDLEALVDEYGQIVDAVTDVDLQNYLRDFGKVLLVEYSIIKSGSGSLNVTLQAYILDITTEITTYADGDYFPTPDEQREKMDELDDRITKAVLNMT
jgi:hypothetical protein